MVYENRYIRHNNLYGEVIIALLQADVEMTFVQLNMFAPLNRPYKITGYASIKNIVKTKTFYR